MYCWFICIVIVLYLYSYSVVYCIFPAFCFVGLFVTSANLAYPDYSSNDVKIFFFLEINIFE